MITTYDRQTIHYILQNKTPNRRLTDYKLKVIKSRLLNYINDKNSYVMQASITYQFNSPVFIIKLNVSYNVKIMEEVYNLLSKNYLTTFAVINENMFMIA